MPIEPEKQKAPLPESSSEENGTPDLPNDEMIKRYVQTQEVDIKNLLPSQVEREHLTYAMSNYT
ncbi:hypothetical protein [Microcystis sp. BLCC-F210]|jgi:hypothetical protein|uniref:hypothetical protein n=1 Tax=Microcystis sp. BLCC-F210 TaxID=3342751 RepID=UPI0035C9209F